MGEGEGCTRTWRMNLITLGWTMEENIQNLKPKPELWELSNVFLKKKYFFLAEHFFPTRHFTILLDKIDKFLRVSPIQYEMICDTEFFLFF